MNEPRDSDVFRALNSIYVSLLGRPIDEAGLLEFTEIWGDGEGAGAAVEKILQSVERRALENRTSLLKRGDRIGVCHIPKCAGTSLAVALQELGLANAALGYNELGTVAAAGASATRPRGEDAPSLRESLASYPVVIGHFDLMTLRAAECSEIVVLLREPRSRIISLFRFWQSLSNETLDAWGDAGKAIREATEQGISAFLGSESIKRDIDNAISAQLVRSQYEDDTWRDQFDALWEQAQGGIAGCYWHSESANLIADLTKRIPGFDSDVYKRRNVTPRSSSKPITLSRHDIATLDDLTRFDYTVCQDLMQSGKLKARDQNSLDGEFLDALSIHSITIE